MKQVNCIYAKRLIDKLVRFNMRATEQEKPLVDIQQIKKAIFFAKEYHKGQFRHSGEPYYSHPIEVAYMVSDYLFRTDILVTAILHDTIEDTALTKEKIAEEFGRKVADQVMDLTRIKEDGIKISAAETVEMLYKEKKHDILLIKLFDRLHNMQTIGAKSPEKIRRIINETLEYFITLCIYITDYMHIKFTEKQLVDLCNKYLPHKEEVLLPAIYNYYNSSL